MITPMKTRPKPSNNNGKRIFLVLLVLAGVVFIVSLFLDRYQGIIQLAALILLTASLFFYNRYLSTTNEYEITTDYDGIPVFVVSSYSTKRVSALCRIALWDIREIVRMRREERKTHQTPKDTSKHDYTPTLSPDSVLCILQRSRYEKSEIFIESNEAFEQCLRDAVEEAYSLRPLDDEE